MIDLIIFSTIINNGGFCRHRLPLDYNEKNILCIFKNTDLQNFDIAQHQVLVISYALAAKNEKLFRAIGFHFVVVDESHQLKNAKSARTIKLTPILKAIKYRILLSVSNMFLVLFLLLFFSIEY